MTRMTSPMYGSANVVVNGNLFATYDNGSVMWTQPGNVLSSTGLDRSVTVSYGKDGEGGNISHYIGSIGISLTADNAGRIAPKYVIITGGTSAGQTCYEEVPLDPLLILYNRYDLLEACWANHAVEWLKIEFPNGTDAYTGFGSYWGGTHPLYLGLSEFQAFAHPNPIPEPATMSLLALGGLALLRQRKR